MKAEKLPSGSYRARVMVNGVSKTFVADTAKEAVRQANEWKYLQNGPVQDMTVGEAMDDYIKSIENIRSPSTVDVYKRIRRNYFQGLLKIKLSKLSQASINHAVNIEREKGLSPKTISNAHGLLTAVLNTYYPDFEVRTKLPRKVKAEKEFSVTPSEIFAAVKGTDIELPVLLAMCLSLSMSEVRGLKKSDIKDGIITIRRSMVYADGKDVVKNEMKTEGRARKLALPAFLQPYIDKVDTEYITEIRSSNLYTKFSRALEKAGLPHITFHDLRHINASVMHLLGVPNKYAMQRGGWKTDSVLKTVYQNTFSEERQKFDNIIDSFFADVVTNS